MAKTLISSGMWVLFDLNGTLMDPSVMLDPPELPVAALEQVAFGPYVFHLERGELRQGEEIIHLTDREREMLRILSQTPGETVPRTALTSGGTVNERAVDVQINRLRRKIERDPANPLFLQAVRGIGYRLVASP